MSVKQNFFAFLNVSTAVSFYRLRYYETFIFTET